MTIEVTYKVKATGNIDEVAVLKYRKFEEVVSKSKEYNKDLDNEFWVSQVTKIEPDGFRNSECLSWGYQEPRPTIRVKETTPLRRSVWDDIYCISEEEQEELDFQEWVNTFNGEGA